jgi:aminoglycoside phosphotransferase (APT) family kinase protein
MLKADDEILAGLRQYLTDAFNGRRLNLVFAHGDYTSENILLEKSRNRICGVFDWDLADEAGLPLLDLLYFLAAAERDRTETSYGTIFARILRCELPVHESALVADYCRALDIPADLVLPLSIMTWIHHLVDRMQTREAGPFPSKLWSEVLEVLSASLRQEIALGGNEVRKCQK